MKYECATSDPSSSLVPGSLNLLGMAFDGTACFRKGAVEGPEAIRKVSFGIESYSPYLERDLASHTFYDLGDITPSPALPVTEQWEHLASEFSRRTGGFDRHTQLLTLGGEHSISYFPIVSYLEEYDDLLLVHLDAHADLRDGYQGFHYSHASLVRRVLDHFGPHHNILQYGIRSGTAEEYRWMKSSGTLISSRESFLQKVNSISPERPIYLTLDLDFFDPAFLPGTGTPEAGGEDFHAFIALMKILYHKKFVGADVVELAPSIDPTGNSSVFATKVVRELLLALSWRKV